MCAQGQTQGKVIGRKGEGGGGEKKRGMFINQMVTVTIPRWCKYRWFSFSTVLYDTSFAASNHSYFNLRKWNKRSLKSFWLPWHLKQLKCHSMTKFISKELLIET